jgi:LPPG:FO 2-phospho-L-lactate transferase
MKVTALAGGVGGAKLAHGLAQVLAPEALSVVVNTGDDFVHLGLRISPDLDTVMYTLGGLANPDTGWGLAGETWSFMEALERLGGATWFRLGDRDLATHVERTRRLAAGETLTGVTTDFCARLGIGVRLLPMTDDSLQTMVHTDEGELAFQEYFVHRQWRPRVTGFRFAGGESARPTAQVREALESADMVLFCPSNPFVSIDPILRLPGVREWLKGKPVVAVTPIVGGQALKGPAAKMLAELGLKASSLAVAEHYGPAVTGFVLDVVDEQLRSAVQAVVPRVAVADTVMKTTADRARLAREVLEFASGL